MRIAILDDYLGQSTRLADWSGLEARGAQVTVFDRHLSLDEAAKALAPFEVVCHLRERMDMPASLIAQLPQLRCIAITGTEHRTLDLAAAHQRGIVVTRSINGATGRRATSELAWGLILALARHLPQAAARMKAGGWQHHCGQTLEGKTLGLVGLGRLGQAMVPAAQAFGMDILAWSPHLTPERATAAGAHWCTKDELLARSDFISLHLVLGERSRHVIGVRELGLMKPTACLVNTARAGLVEPEALLGALRERRIAGAALDVFEQEPLPDDHPLRGLDNAILTPHLGYTVEETLRAFYEGMVDNLLAFMDGRPQNLVAAK
jgi:D-3-phosphoglycerate dehydrogenase